MYFVLISLFNEIHYTPQLITPLHQQRVGRYPTQAKAVERLTSLSPQNTMKKPLK